MFYARGATARSENEMIAYSAPPFPIRAILNRVGLGPKQHRWSRDGGIRRNLRRRLFAVLGKWSSVSALAGRGEILLRGRPERFRRFCRDCREYTAHEGFDELGVGWYAQICCCLRCGEQGMSVWPLALW